MRSDIRGHPLFQEVEAVYRDLKQPGSGQASEPASISVASGKTYAAFSGTIAHDLEGDLHTRICIIDLVTSRVEVVSGGPNSDQSPKCSPKDDHIAFLSDRTKEGDYQLYILDVIANVVRTTPKVEGWIEYLHWSSDGNRILLGVAGHGADISGIQGAIASKGDAEAKSAWMPAVSDGNERCRWRNLWIYDLSTNEVRPIGEPDLNIWEATWCGDDAVAAVVSDSPEEGSWYRAELRIMPIATAESHLPHLVQNQLGIVVGCPNGRQVAFVEAVCSDRSVIAGDLLIFDRQLGRSRKISTQGVDITHVEWQSDHDLMVAGHRGLETVVGIVRTDADSFKEVWASRTISTEGRFASVSALHEIGNCALIGVSFSNGPEIALIQDGEYRCLRSFGLGYGGHASVIGKADSICWTAPDGMEIQGWLLCPKDAGPHPLVMNLHGGPIWHWRAFTLNVLLLMLISRGYAIFLPNPRGSSGRGQQFASAVVGDLCGADAEDLLAGLDRLIDLGIADPHKLGVMGLSYGGLMTSWLISQDPRFAAAVTIGPITNMVTQDLLSNIPEFPQLFLLDKYTSTYGLYHQRSPVMYAGQVQTPTLNICGELDRCTPPTEAIQFHNALLRNGVQSVLVNYPEEGHGIRKFPAVIDYTTRLVEWFETYMPADRSRNA